MTANPATHVLTMRDFSQQFVWGGSLRAAVESVKTESGLVIFEESVQKTSDLVERRVVFYSSGSWADYEYVFVPHPVTEKVEMMHATKKTLRCTEAAIVTLTGLLKLFADSHGFGIDAESPLLICPSLIKTRDEHYGGPSRIGRLYQPPWAPQDAKTTSDYSTAADIELTRLARNKDTGK